MKTEIWIIKSEHYGAKSRLIFDYYIIHVQILCSDDRIKNTYILHAFSDEEAINKIDQIIITSNHTVVIDDETNLTKDDNSNNLTYQQALECLLCNECEYISCERGIEDDADIIMLDGNAELIIDGSFNDDDYSSNNWFLG